MHRQVQGFWKLGFWKLGFWKAGSIVAASALLVLHPVAASPRLVSLAFNSQLQSPQQMGADELRRKLVAAGKRIVLDERATNALGSENVILAATQSGAVPELGVFDIPFLFRDAAQTQRFGP